MKLSSAQRKALRAINLKSVGRGKLGLKVDDLDRAGITAKTVAALVKRGLVVRRRLDVGVHSTRVHFVTSTAEGRIAA